MDFLSDCARGETRTPKVITPTASETATFANFATRAGGQRYTTIQNYEIAAPEGGADYNKNNRKQGKKPYFWRPCGCGVIGSRTRLRIWR